MTRSTLYFIVIMFMGAVFVVSSVAFFSLAPRLFAVAANSCACRAAADPSGWLWAAAAGAGLVLIRFVLATIRTARRTRQFLIRTLPEARRIDARRLGLITHWTIDLVPGSAAVFCYGLWRPRLAIGERMFSLLDQAQLQAVVVHESAHARRRDPLRLFLATVVSEMLSRWFGGRTLLQAFTVHVECDADQAAVLRVGRLSLANAFLRLLDTGSLSRGAAVPFLSVTETRILRLLGEERRPRIGLAVVAAVAIGLLGLLGLRAAARAAESTPAITHGAMCTRPPVCAAPRPEAVRCLTADRATVCVRQTLVEPLSRLQ